MVVEIALKDIIERITRVKEDLEEIYKLESDSYIISELSDIRKDLIYIIEHLTVISNIRKSNKKESYKY